MASLCIALREIDELIDLYSDCLQIKDKIIYALHFNQSLNLHDQHDQDRLIHFYHDQYKSKIYILIGPHYAQNSQQLLKELLNMNHYQL